MYESFEHTADVGLRVCAPDLDTLFQDAACGLFSLIVEDINTIEATLRVAYTLEATDTESLLIDWLNELLFTFATRHLLFSRFDVRVRGTQLSATAMGQSFDPERHQLGPEVKAVTYHGVPLSRTPDGYTVQIIIDI